MFSPNTNRKLLKFSSKLTSTSNNTSTTNDNNDPSVQTCLNFCNSQKNTTNSSLYKGFCPQVCLAICPSLCHYSTNSIPLPPTIPNKPHTNHSPILISMLILLAITFLLITVYILYTKLYFHFYAPYSNSSPQTRPRRIRRIITSDNNNNNNNINSLDDDHDHHRVIFHPFWYISTIGLSATEIQQISVVEYRKEMMEEKDCVVCLGEFEEGENLRILPKCSHVFHLPCIDTWLSLHTTCPLCRGPIFSTNHVDDDDHNDHNQVVENASSSIVSMEAEAKSEN